MTKRDDSTTANFGNLVAEAVSPDGGDVDVLNARMLAEMLTRCADAIERGSQFDEPLRGFVRRLVLANNGLSDPRPLSQLKLQKKHVRRQLLAQDIHLQNVPNTGCDDEANGLLEFVTDLAIRECAFDLPQLEAELMKHRELVRAFLATRLKNRGGRGNRPRRLRGQLSRADIWEELCAAMGWPKGK